MIARASVAAAVLLACASLAVAGSASAASSSEPGPVLARSYEIRFRPLADAADLVSTVLSPDGSVTLRPKLRMLVVQDHAQVLDRVGSLLQSFDLPPRSVEVTLGLFLGVDRREAEAGREAAPSPSRDVRGVTESLSDFTRWTSYESLGSRSVVGAEGSRVVSDLGDDYRVEFDLEGADPANKVIRFRNVSLLHVIRTAGGEERTQVVYTVDVVVNADQMKIVGIAKGPESKKALFLSLKARLR